MRAQQHATMVRYRCRGAGVSASQPSNGASCGQVEWYQGTMNSRDKKCRTSSGLSVPLRAASSRSCKRLCSLKLSSFGCSKSSIISAALSTSSCTSTFSESELVFTGPLSGVLNAWKSRGNRPGRSWPSWYHQDPNPRLDYSAHAQCCDISCAELASMCTYKAPGVSVTASDTAPPLVATGVWRGCNRVVLLYGHHGHSAVQPCHKHWTRW